MTSSWSATPLEDYLLNLLLNTSLNYLLKKKESNSWPAWLWTTNGKITNKNKTLGPHEYKLQMTKLQIKEKYTPGPQEFKLWTMEKKWRSSVSTIQVAYNKIYKTYYISSSCIKTRWEVTKRLSTNLSSIHPSLKAEWKLHLQHDLLMSL